MTGISIIGVGRTSVGEHWDSSLRKLGNEAIEAALLDAGLELSDVDSLVVANALGGRLNNQNHVSALIADYSGLHGVDAMRVEAADASGGMAVRQAIQMIIAGAAQIVVVVGVEKVTDLVGGARHNALATILDMEYEAAHGATPTAIAALLMRRYMVEYKLELAQFEGFSINAHASGKKNPKAMFRNLIKPGKFASASMVSPPVNLFDSAPEADGASALILTTTENAQKLKTVAKPIQIAASAAASDVLALHSRADILFLRAVNLAMGRVCQQAGMKPDDMDMAELHDSYTVLTALQLEAAGFAERGEGWKMAAEEQIMPGGSLPISTFGGLKARGNPLGATGIYQIAEIALQLQERAGDNQIAGVKNGLALNVGGIGATAVAHILTGNKS